ncbi:MAG: eno [Candidatus Magasanikbacteria bacterium]|nr:eno [Candidatus Magasanikbacteria bacterium]
MKIKSIQALEILDSRGNPTVRAVVTLTDGAVGSASVPSGASTGAHEALELRDGGKRYGGKGVLKAVANIQKKIASKLIGLDASKQRAVDEVMLKLDGTKNKSRLGANAILGVSLAVARAAATSAKEPLYQYLRQAFNLKHKNFRLPVATMNIINGGVHADSGLSVQEFMIIPQNNKMNERVRMGAEVFHALKGILKADGFATSVGDEGGFAPRLGGSEKALQVIVRAITKAGYKVGHDVMLGMDVAASEFFENGIYNFEGKKLTPEKMMEMAAGWGRKYPLISIEDPLAEDDWDNWVSFTSKHGHKFTIVGDDFFVTNKERLAQGIRTGAANAILIKLNQIGSLSETIDTILLAQKNNYKISVSHRSGETADTFIADLAVAVNAEFIKTGSLSRSERVEKYNRLMEIEREIK